MNRKQVMYLLSIIAVLVIVILSVIYWVWPTNIVENPLHTLVLNLIPNAIVAIAAAPIVYWLFERQGINIFPARKKAAHDSNGKMMAIPEEMNKAASEKPVVPNDGQSEGKAVLVIVDAQVDFITGSLKAYDADKIIMPINRAIRMAEAKEIPIIFTKDWHPSDHVSFRETGGAWPSHCVQNTSGADISPLISMPSKKLIVEFGVQAGEIGYSPLENQAFLLLLRTKEITTVYTCGIALEYCIQSFCRGVLELGKNVIALEPAIATANNNSDDIDRVWKELIELGVKREPNLTVISEET